MASGIKVNQTDFYGENAATKYLARPRNFKFAVVFQKIAMIGALEVGDFILDVTLAVWVFYVSTNSSSP